MPLSGPSIKKPKHPEQSFSVDWQGGKITRGELWELCEGDKRGAAGIAKKIGVTARTVFRWIHGEEHRSYGPVSVHDAIAKLLKAAR